MKIVFLYHGLTFIGGVDRVLVDKLNYFADVLNYEVYLITTQQFGQKPFFSLSNKVHHLDLGIDFNLQYRHNFLKRAVIYSKLLREYKKTVKYHLYNIKADIVITTVARELDFLMDMKDGSKKIAEAHDPKKYVRALHRFDEGGLIKRLIGHYLRRKLEKKIMKLDAFVTLTNKDALNWSKVCKPLVIPNSLPFVSQKQSKCEIKNIICVGRLEYQKGFDLLIEAWSQINEFYPDWKITIYGNGTEHQLLSDLIISKNLTESVTIKVPVNKIIDKYLESSIFILSSRYEGFGMVIIEAMACGLPVISYDCPEGPSEIINDGVDGFLVPLNDINELSKKISILIEDQNLRKAMGKRAKQNVRRYSKDNIMEEWRKLFNSLLSH